jgi:hypothetical protein
MTQAPKTAGALICLSFAAVLMPVAVIMPLYACYGAVHITKVKFTPVSGLFVLSAVWIVPQAALAACLESLAEQALGSLLGSFRGHGDIDGVRSVDLDRSIDRRDVARLVINWTFVDNHHLLGCNCGVRANNG